MLIHPLELAIAIQINAGKLETFDWWKVKSPGGLDSRSWCPCEFFKPYPEYSESQLQEARQSGWTTTTCQLWIIGTDDHIHRITKAFREFPYLEADFPFLFSKYFWRHTVSMSGYVQEALELQESTLEAMKLRHGEIKGWSVEDACRYVTDLKSTHRKASKVSDLQGSPIGQLKAINQRMKSLTG